MDRGPTLAVIPLVDLGPKSGKEYFGVGLTQELVASIAAFQELTVVALPPLEGGDSVAAAAARFGREFGTRFVLSGTFRRTDDRLVVRMELTDTKSSAIDWTEKITRDLSARQVFDLEETIGDSELQNEAAQRFHQHMGFQETYRVVGYRKVLQ